MNSPSLAFKSAGVALVVCSLAFVAVFTYLASNFGYPEVLDRSASDVLPLLAGGGDSLRIVWFIYGVLPLGIVFAGAASASMLGQAGHPLRTLGLTASAVAGTAMMVGLLRWPTIMDALARHWQTSSPEQQLPLAATFDAVNSFMGNLVGEFVGEIALATWFVATAVAFRRNGRRVLGNLGVGAAVLLGVAAFRNVTNAVALVAEINNVVLPLWLLTLGVMFFRDGFRRASQSGQLRHEMPAGSSPSSV